MKKQIMTRAWEIAKGAAVEFGGSSKEYFALSLKQAWAESRKPAVIEIPEWIVRKNVGDVIVVQKSVLKVVRETEKAIQIEADGKFGRFNFWSPKSVLKTENVTDFATATVVVEDKMMKAMDNHFDLVEEARALGIKGIRSNMKSATLRKKIAEHKAA